jgi:hypothetical protein
MVSAPPPGMGRRQVRVGDVGHPGDPDRAAVPRRNVGPALGGVEIPAVVDGCGAGRLRCSVRREALPVEVTDCVAPAGAAIERSAFEEIGHHPAVPAALHRRAHELGYLERSTRELRGLIDASLRPGNEVGRGVDRDLALDGERDRHPPSDGSGRARRAWDRESSWILVEHGVARVLAPGAAPIAAERDVLAVPDS